MTPPLTNECPYCQALMRPTELHCERCCVRIRGAFPTTPLAELPTEHQRFIEMFVLASGNLKEIASHAGVSYPTVRSRLDKVIAALRSAIAGHRPASSAADGSQQSAEATAAEIIKRI